MTNFGQEIETFALRYQPFYTRELSPFNWHKTTVQLLVLSFRCYLVCMCHKTAQNGFSYTIRVQDALLVAFKCNVNSSD